MKKVKLVTLVLCVVMAASLLAGCGGNSNATTADGYAKEIYLYNWSEYMLPEVLEGFEQEYGIKVIETTFESNDEMLAKLLAGNNGEYDIAVPSNFYIEAMLENDLIEELDMSVITNITNIDDAYRSLSYDPEGKYTIPYMGTVALWMGNTDKIAELGVSANSYKDLEDPKYANNILFSDDTQGNICCGFLATGNDPLSTDQAAIDAARDWLISINKNVKAYSLPADVRDSMIRGEAAVAYMYSGNAMQAMFENDKLVPVLDEERVSLSVDTMVVLKGSKHKTEAQLFLNYLLRPDVSAKLTEAFPYVCFNKAAVEYLPEQYSSNPLCILTPDMQSRIFMINTFDGETLSAEVDAMAAVMTAR